MSYKINNCEVRNAKVGPCACACAAVGDPRAALPGEYGLGSGMAELRPLSPVPAGGRWGGAALLQPVPDEVPALLQVEQQGASPR
jgi:hypothetical protein